MANLNWQFVGDIRLHSNGLKENEYKTTSGIREGIYRIAAIVEVSTKSANKHVHKKGDRKCVFENKTKIIVYSGAGNAVMNPSQLFDSCL